MRVFITGVAGFIGFHVAKCLLESGHQVWGYDNLNDYYDPSHKVARLEVLHEFTNFEFLKGDLCDQGHLGGAWRRFEPSHVVHLAAQAGVRYSLVNPDAYIKSNIVGFQNVIDLVRQTRPTNFVYASSSSVYGGNRVLPFCESHEVSNPISLYAATKISNELVARTYANLFGLPSTGLRFFTVYGPYSRPDMAMFKFANLMMLGEPLPIYNGGQMLRDFTYIEDIVKGVLASIAKPQVGQVYNLGRGKQVNLIEMVAALETNLGVKAKLDLMPMQAGDVEATFASIEKAQNDLGYSPKTDIDIGVKKFAEWFRGTNFATYGKSVASHL